MKTWFSLLGLLAGLSVATAGEPLLVIDIDVFPLASPYPKNWCELLWKRRGGWFDYGDFDVHSADRQAQSFASAPFAPPVIWRIMRIPICSICCWFSCDLTKGSNCSALRISFAFA